MGNLILADRHQVRAVDGNVGRLKQRISEEADGGEILVAQRLLLFLVRRHTLEPRNRHDHREQQVQLGMLRHHRLHKKCAALRVQACRDPVDHVVIRVRGKTARVRVVARQRVPIRHEIETVVLLLECHPVLQRAHQMAEMQLAGGTHSGHNSLFGGTHLIPNPQSPIPSLKSQVASRKSCG